MERENDSPELMTKIGDKKQDPRSKIANTSAQYSFA